MAQPPIGYISTSNRTQFYGTQRYPPQYAPAPSYTALPPPPVYTPPTNEMLAQGVYSVAYSLISYLLTNSAV